MKLNEMNGGLGHLCALIGLTGPGQLPEDGEMNEMALPSRHRIQNSSPGGLRSNTLPLGHNIESLRVCGGETFVSFKLLNLKASAGFEWV